MNVSISRPYVTLPCSVSGTFSIRILPSASVIHIDWITLSFPSDYWSFLFHHFIVESNKNNVDTCQKVPGYSGNPLSTAFSWTIFCLGAYIHVTTLKAVAAKSPSKANALEEALPLSFESPRTHYVWYGLRLLMHSLPPLIHRQELAGTTSTETGTATIKSMAGHFSGDSVDAYSLTKGWVHSDFGLQLT